MDPPAFARLVFLDNSRASRTRLWVPHNLHKADLEGYLIRGAEAGQVSKYATLQRLSLSSD